MHTQFLEELYSKNGANSMFCSLDVSKLGGEKGKIGGNPARLLGLQPTTRDTIG